METNTDWGQPDSGDPFANSAEEQASVAEADPRLRALGIEQDFAAAEA